MNMEFLSSLLNTQMEKPEIFGLFHILSLVVMLGLIVAFFFLFKKNKEKRIKIALIIFSIIFIIFEVLKQVLFTYQAGHYQWYAFPFQFCSTPIYVVTLAVIVKNEKLKTALYNFLAFYGVLGGLLVMFYPGDVFTTDVFINFQTMIHHMSMVLVGFALAFAGKLDFSWRGFLNSIIVFAVLILIALTLDIIGHYANVGTFNMFFISPFQPSSLPVFSIIYEKAPYPIFLLSYLLGFSLGALLIKFAFQGLTGNFTKKIIVAKNPSK